jgi:hypothetical protein
MAKPPALLPSQAEADRITALLPAANAGDRAALAELRAVLDASPQLWTELGNLGRHAELALVRVAAGTNSVAKEAIVRKLDALRREVAGPTPTPLERLLADRVAIGWLSLVVAEGIYHQALERGLDEGDDDFHQRRVERAQRRYLAAIKTLVQVRKPGVSAVQVNIGDKQINVAGLGSLSHGRTKGMHSLMMVQCREPGSGSQADQGIGDNVAETSPPNRVSTASVQRSVRGAGPTPQRRMRGVNSETLISRRIAGLETVGQVNTGGWREAGRIYDRL